MAKPAGLLAQGDASGAPSLINAVRKYLTGKTRKQDPFVGLVHRLDRNVEGVMVFAKTKQAASELSDQIRRRQVKKFYRCLVEGRPEPESAKLIHFIRKGKSLKATVFPKSAPDAKRAVLVYRVLHSKKDFSLLEVELHTGRFHQIRAQLSFVGHPIVGDTKYRATTSLGEFRIALYANRFVLNHPSTCKEMSIEAPSPEWED